MNTPSRPPVARHVAPRLAASLLAAFVVTLAGCSSISGSLPKPEPIVRVAPAQTFAYRFTAADGTEPMPGLIRHEDAVAMVRRALEQRGMVEATSARTADVVLSLDYSVGPPTPAEKLAREPIIKRVYQSAPKIQANGANVQLGAHNVETQLLKPPDVEVVGYRTRRTPVLVHEKRLRIIAHAATSADAGTDLALWSIDVTSEGISRNLIDHLPSMAAAGINHIDRESRGNVVLKLTDTNEIGNIVR